MMSGLPIPGMGRLERMEPLGPRAYRAWLRGGGVLTGTYWSA